MGDAGVSGGWIEERTIQLASSDGLSHGVVDFEDDALGAVLAVFLLILALDDGGNMSLCQDGRFGDPDRYAAMSPTGNSSHVRPSRARPVRFLCTPPHCLKKKATPAAKH